MLNSYLLLISNALKASDNQKSTNMNHKIIIQFLIISGVLLLSCQSTKDTTTPPTDKVIKTAKKYKVNPRSGEKQLQNITHFDMKGKETKRVEYKKEAISREVLFEYDEQGNQIKTIEKKGEETLTLGTYDYKENFKVHEKTPYGYTFFDRDDKGDLVAERAFNSDGTIDLFLFHKYKYEGEQLIAKLTTEQKEVGAKPKERQLERFTYNDKGKVMQRHLLSVYDERTFTNTYHSNGQLKQTIEIAFKNKEKVVYHFNTNGKKTKVEVYRRKTTKDEFQLDLMNHWVYNEFGDLIEMKSERGGTVIRQTIIELEYY